jgi:hypothetical protein
MDADRFDALTRSLTTAPSRRSLLAGLLAGASARLTFRGERAEARRRKRKKPCGTETCSGCCRNGTCVTDPDATCGTLFQGEQCLPCSPGEFCDRRDDQFGKCKCAPGMCAAEINGCCDQESDRCRPGTSPKACGKRGEACEPCLPNEVCQNRRCCIPERGPCDADLSPLNPCCGNAVCVGGKCCPDEYRCKGTCCPRGTKCVDGVCKCDVERCQRDLNGCCDPDPLRPSLSCAPGTSKLACGKPGTICRNCVKKFGSASTCVNRACTCPQGCLRPDGQCCGDGARCIFDDRTRTRRCCPAQSVCHPNGETTCCPSDMPRCDAFNLCQLG